MEIKLFPLSFKDFYDYEIQLVKTQSLNELAKIWKKYLDFGGLPGQLIYEDKQQLQKQYINSVYNDILVKDILNRYTIEHVDEFNRICRFLLKNIGGKKISLRKIVDIGNQENK
jgi:predicted AAA+ superfamily ATPase